MANPTQNVRPRRQTKAKREILGILAEMFVLRSKDVARILRSRAPTESDIRSVNHTLQLLEAAGLVHRIRYLNTEDDGVGYACGLTDEGRNFVYENGMETDATKTFDDHSERTLDHELEISFFHIALKRFLCDQFGLKLYWRQADLKKAVHPDALFAITEPKKPDSKSTNYFFLEIERAKLGSYLNGEPQIVRKLRSYYDYYNSSLCAKEWKDFSQFRVIVVQRTEERCQNLLNVLKKDLNHRMFLLTTEPRYKSNIAAPCFFTPKDAGVSLLDL